MQRRHLLLFALLLAVISAAGWGAYHVWRKQQRVAAAAAGVSALPDLARWPESFRSRLSAASASVRSSDKPEEALGELAALYFVNGFSQEAQHALKTLRQMDGGNARCAYLTGTLYLRNGDNRSAETSFEQAVKLDPAYAPAWIRLGQLQTQRRALEAARASFTKAVELAGSEPWAPFELISFEAHHGNAGDPLGSLTRLVAQHPGIRQLHELLAELYEVVGNRDAALREHQQAAAATRLLPAPDPWIDALTPLCHDANRLSLIGLKHMRERRLKEAEDAFVRAVQLEPTDASLWYQLADVYGAKGDVAEACSVLRRAMSAVPGDHTLPVRLAQLLSMDGKHAEALQVVEQALVRWPDIGAVHAAHGFLLRDSKRYAEAANAFRTSLRHNPTLADAQFGLGWSLLQQGETTTGKREVEKALVMRPDYPDALFALSMVLLQEGKLTEAEAHAQKLLNLAVPDVRGRRLIAVIRLVGAQGHARAGDLLEAERLLREGIASDPEFAALHQELGNVAFARDRFTDSAAAFRRYTMMAPEDPEGYIGLAQALRANRNEAEALKAFEAALSAAGKQGDASKVDQIRQLLRR